MSDLNEKIKKNFPNESVYKSPKLQKIFDGFTIPSFVKDWLIKKFSFDYELNYDDLKAFLNKHIISKSSKIKGDLINGKDIKILARINIEPDIKKGRIRFEIPDIGIKLNEGEVPEYIYAQHPELKGGEVWGVVKLTYIPPQRINNKKEPGKIEICEFHPFKPYKVDLEYYKHQRKNFTIDEWIDLLICSMEYNPKSFDSLSQKLLFITRLLVFIEPNLNIIELAPKGTGKSYVFGNLSKYAWMFSGGTVSRAKLLYDIARSVPGIITKFDIIAFDEIETIKFSNEEELQGALKSYLESGTFSLANFKGVSQASFMLLGNIPLTNSRRPISKKYFSKLPDFFQHSALLDRFHGFIEGWKLPRMKNDMILDGFALNMEYFSEILHELRSVSDYSYIVNRMLKIPQKADTRDTRAITKIATAYLKLLFPHISSPNDLDKNDFETFCLEPAKKMRQIIKTQLNLIDSEFKAEIPDITIY